MVSKASPIRHGSIKNKIVSSDLEEERKKCDFDQSQLTHFLHGGKAGYDQYKEWIRVMESDPILRTDQTWYEMTREEQMNDLFKKTKRIYELDRTTYFHNYEISYY